MSADLREDLKKFAFPTYEGHLSIVYGDGYFWHSLKKKYNMTDEELDTALKEVVTPKESRNPFVVDFKPMHLNITREDQTMPSNLPDGVTPSMIPGNSDEAASHIDFEERAMAIFYSMQQEVWTHIHDLSQRKSPVWVDDFSSVMTDIVNLVDDAANRLDDLIIESLPDEPDLDYNPHEMEDF